MRQTDARLDELLGSGAAVFRASFDLFPDPVAIAWAIRDPAGAVIDFEGVHANPAMGRMFGASYWLLTVEDNGIAIPAELGDDAFAMFQARPRRRPRRLWHRPRVCRKILEAHGGAIAAAPVPGAEAAVALRSAACRVQTSSRNCNGGSATGS